jgi:hypothetical protein
MGFPLFPVAQPMKTGLPANDGYNTRLHAGPEIISAPTPSKSPQTRQDARPSPIDWQVLTTYAAIALGAALLAIGLWISWKSGILNVSAPKRAPANTELNALFLAAGGFIILIVSTVSAIASRGQSDEDETSLSR